MMMALATASRLVVICCNGGLPYVDLHLWPHEHSAFRTIDLTDWVATDRTVADWFTSQDVDANDTLSLPDWLSLPVAHDFELCDVYNLTFSTKQLEHLFVQQNGSLACDCPLGTLGTACEIRASELTAHREAVETSGSGGFAFLMLLVLLPVAFVTFAVLGALLCKFCLLDFPQCWQFFDRRRKPGSSSMGSRCCCRRRSTSGENEVPGQSRRRSSQPMDPELLDRLMRRAEKYKRERGGGGDGGEVRVVMDEDAAYRPTTMSAGANPVGDDAVPLMTVSGRIDDDLSRCHFGVPPAASRVDRSPPPSYKSEASSPEQIRRHFNAPSAPPAE